MPLSLQQKESFVSEVEQMGSTAVGTVLIDYRGIKANDMNELRRRARQNNIQLKVLRNRLAKRALKDCSLSCALDVLTGPTLIAVSDDDPGAAARLVKKFNDEFKVFELKALTINDQLLTPDQLKAVTSLPTYDVAVSMLMSTMLAPVTLLARTIKEPVAQVVRAVSAVGQSKNS